jgi:hypothetical protein
MGKTSTKLENFARVAMDLGPAHASTNYTLSGGFGSTATVTLTDCTDACGRVRISCAGTGQGANPTCTIAYNDVAPDRPPHVVIARGGGSQATITMSVTSEFTTGCIFTFNGTAAGTEQYVFTYVAIG